MRRDTAAGVDAPSAGRIDLQVKTSMRSVRPHDEQGPAIEARRRVDAALNERPVPPLAIVVGVGDGFAIDELQRRRPDIRILALELAPELLGDWAARDTIRASMASGRLLVGVAPAFQIPAPAWPVAVVDEPPLILVHPVLAQHFPEPLARARTALKQFLYEQRANAEARRRLARLYFDHTIENLPAVAMAADVSALDGTADGRTLVLIGAGPSLDRMLPTLAAHRERAWYVALDTALKPLLQSGIVPDLVVSVDPTPLNGRHLLNLPTRARPWLVAEASLDPHAIAAFAGRTFFCKIGRADPWPWLEALDLAPTKLQVWGSVLTASCDLFTRMRASTVVFTGLDLSYTNDQPYCRGTAFEDDWRGQREQEGLPSLEAVWEKRIAEIAVEDIDEHGRPVRTAPQMIAFRNWVRSIVAASPDRRFVNASEGGILHGPGIEQRRLADTLARLSGTVPADKTLRAASTRSFAAAVPRLVIGLESVANAAADRPLWAGWQESIPNFDVEQTRRRLEHAARRIRAQRGAAQPATRTDWVDVPYAAANFGAKAPMAWTPSQENVITYAYQMRGTTMTLSFKIQFSTVTGYPTRELHLRIPAARRSVRSVANTVWIFGIAGREMGYATVEPAADTVVIHRANGGRFSLQPASLFVFGQLTFEAR